MCVCVCALTAQVLQDEIEFPSCLEGIDEIHDEGMLHLLQDVPLCLGVGRVLGVADDHRLVESDETELRRGHTQSGSAADKTAGGGDKVYKRGCGCKNDWRGSTSSVNIESGLLTRRCRGCGKLSAESNLPPSG